MNEQVSEGYAKAERLFDEERYEEAFTLFHICAEQGDIHVHVLLGWMYHHGLGVEENHQEARRWYLLAAQAGSPAGEFNLGVLAMHEQDYQKGREWFEKAAAHGYYPALYRLGWIYKVGSGVGADQNRAHHIFEQAAEKGHLLSQMAVARQLMRGYKGQLHKLKGLFLFIKTLPHIAWVAHKNPKSDRIRE